MNLYWSTFFNITEELLLLIRRLSQNIKFVFCEIGEEPKVKGEDLQPKGTLNLRVRIPVPDISWNVEAS